ncbi:MAG: helix-hairpin-helix domain-containing protein [Desulfuromonadales bacterium]|nr:helix-hairpin-helix domain-containing protein [Desulfuromonadales bacterium]
MKKKIVSCLLFALFSLVTLGVPFSFAADGAVPVNINQATVLELQELPGVGPALAERIVAYRETNGAFKSAEQLAEVKGIGQKKMEKFKDKIVLE